MFSSHGRARLLQEIIVISSRGVPWFSAMTINFQNENGKFYIKRNESPRCAPGRHRGGLSVGASAIEHLGGERPDPGGRGVARVGGKADLGNRHE
jgi:hypothetical protein